MPRHALSYRIVRQILIWCRPILPRRTRQAMRDCQLYRLLRKRRSDLPPATVLQLLGVRPIRKVRFGRDRASRGYSNS